MLFCENQKIVHNLQKIMDAPVKKIRYNQNILKMRRELNHDYHWRKAERIHSFSCKGDRGERCGPYP